MEGGFFVNIHESAEDYLEAILKLREDHGMVRSIDIVHELGFSKPVDTIPDHDDGLSPVRPPQSWTYPQAEFPRRSGPWPRPVCRQRSPAQWSQFP